MYLVDPAVNPSDYAAFLAAHPRASLQQSLPWAQVKEAWKALRFGLRRQDQALIGTAQVLLRPLPLGLSFAYLPYGPLLEDASDMEARVFFLEAIKEELRKHGAFVLRVHFPELYRAGSMEDFREGLAQPRFDQETFAQALLPLGFHQRKDTGQMDDSTQPRLQAIVLKEDWEDPPKGRIRYQMRLAERYQMELCAEKEAALDRFMPLIAATEKRQKIRLRDRSYFALLLKAFAPKAWLYTATLAPKAFLADRKAALATVRASLACCPDTAPRKRRQLEELLVARTKDMELAEALVEAAGSHEESLTPAAMLAIHTGQYAEMPYAGSDEAFHRLPAAFALYCKGIQDAFAAGCTRYNLGGLSPGFEDGLAIFKSHFNPCIEETMGEFDAVLQPWAYRLFTWALALRKILRQKA